MSRPKHFEQYIDIVEIVPGVFINSEDGVYIVDDVGEVAMWSPTEWEDPFAVSAALTAVALAAAKGAAAVRKNLETKGKIVDQLVVETRERIDREVNLGE